MRHRPPTPPLVLAAVLATSAAAAQVAPAPSAPTYQSDADALAAQMRIVAAEPTNIDALAAAGELSARVGDLSGAASLFARADKANPRSGRVKAGEAEVLLRSERPGEALRYWSQAEAFGWPVVKFAAERGLAYDLVGQQGRAQRDYRTALAAAPGDPEVTRRYAVSLGISGQRDAALQLLDPLTSRGDRGAWRARAFVLAMGGDTTSADAIASGMMAPGQATGLEPFFARLATMGPADRAFAVQYGEVRATPQRLADARLAPALPPLAPEVITAARARPPIAVAAAGGSARRPDRRRSPGTQVAAAQPATSAGQPAPAATGARAQFAAAQPARPRPPSTVYYLPGSMIPRTLPREAATAAAPASAQTAATSAVQPASPAAQPASPPAQLALATPPRSTPITSAPAGVGVSGEAQAASAPVGAGQVSAPPVAPVQPPAPTPYGDAIFARIAGALAAPGRELAEAGERASAAASETTPAAPAAAVAEPPARVATGTSVAPPTFATEAVPLAAARGPVRPGRRGAAAETADRTPSGRDMAAIAPTDLAPRRSRTGQGAEVASDAPSPEEKTRRGRHGRAIEAAAADAPPDAPAPEQTSSRQGRYATSDAAAADDPSAKRHGRHGRGEEVASADDPAERTPAERRAAARKAAADKKAAAEKEEARKAAAEERRAERADPRRYWVQVAGGANEHDLPKAWAVAKDKAPELSKQKAWTTPLRATNRVLAGPFKTDEAARSFVNKLKKQGFSAFQFTSEAGQKVSRLDGE